MYHALAGTGPDLNLTKPLPNASADTTPKIGAALIAQDGTLIGRGHNQRVQLGSAIHHGETSALYNSGRLPARAYKGATMYTTLSPCDMCESGSFHREML